MDFPANTPANSDKGCQLISETDSTKPAAPSSGNGDSLS